jgi:hypothetical protein
MWIYNTKTDNVLYLWGKTMDKEKQQQFFAQNLVLEAVKNDYKSNKSTNRANLTVDEEVPID